MWECRDGSVLEHEPSRVQYSVLLLEPCTQSLSLMLVGAFAVRSRYFHLFIFFFFSFIYQSDVVGYAGVLYSLFESE